MSGGRERGAGGAGRARRVSGASTSPARKGEGRCSARWKATVVLELFRGTELEETSRKYGVTTATLTSWREAFLTGGEAGRKTRTGRAVNRETETLKSAVTNPVGQRAPARTGPVARGRETVGAKEVEESRE